MKNKWLVLIAAALGMFVTNFDGGAIGILLPSLQDVFSAAFYQVQWVWLVGLLTLVVVLAIAGWLGDVLGKRRVYIAGCLVYIAGTLLIIFAPSIMVVTLARVIQAAGITAYLGLGAAIVTAAFEEKERGLALGLFNLLGLFGVLAGPMLAGIFLESAAWNTVFWVSMGLTVLTLIMALIFLPPDAERISRTFDFPGTLALLVFLGSLLLALTMGQNVGFGAPVIFALGGLSIVSLGLFIWIESRSNDPIVELAFFKERMFSFNLIFLLLAMIALNGYGFLMPFYLQNVLGLSTIQMGLLLALVFGLIMALTAPLGGALSDRFGTWIVTLAGLAMLLVGTIAATTLSENSSQGQFLLCFAPIGIGIGLLITPVTSAIMGSLPSGRLGMGSSLVSITINIAGTIGIALMGTFWSVRAAARIVLPEGGASAAPPAIQAEALQETFFLAAAIITTGLLLNLRGLILSRRKYSSQNHQGVL